jgi:hypothetical protein
MSHPIYRARSFEIVAPYALRVRFEDNTQQSIDFRPVLAGELYGPLRNLELFDQVRIDPEVDTLVWPDGSFRNNRANRSLTVAAPLRFQSRDREGAVGSE